MVNVYETLVLSGDAYGVNVQGSKRSTLRQKINYMIYALIYKVKSHIASIRELFGK